jgi:hypothetical protein
MHNIDSCPFCGGECVVTGSDGLVYVFCQQCLVRGPAKPKSAHAENDAVKSWNDLRMFGGIGIVAARPGLPSATASLAERLRLISAAMMEGKYDGPDSAVLVLRQGNRAQTLTHRIARNEAKALMAAVISS